VIQLRLLAPPVTAPTVTGFWAAMGEWITGGPEPLPLSALIVAHAHRRRVRGGGR
jgi:hypothetical protein